VLKTKKYRMQFTPLENSEQLLAISQSKDYGVILKHNTTCSISKGVLGRLQAAVIPQVDSIYVLDLLAQRDLSNEVAGRFGVPHQSPQILLIRDGRCTYHEWGFDISAEEVSRVIGSHLPLH
jgi:bacillithiol system protein YtxJ